MREEGRKAGRDGEKEGYVINPSSLPRCFCFPVSAPKYARPQNLDVLSKEIDPSSTAPLFFFFFFEGLRNKTKKKTALARNLNLTLVPRAGEVQVLRGFCAPFLPHKHRPHKNLSPRKALQGGARDRRDPCCLSVPSALYDAEPIPSLVRAVFFAPSI